jgi:hypothetical protein
MTTSFMPALSSCGHALKMDDASFGELSDSSPLLENLPVLRKKMDDEGYLFIRRLIDPSVIRTARQSLVSKLESRGLLQPGTDPEDGILKEGTNLSFLPEIAQKDEAVHRVVFGPEIKAFYSGFLGGSIRHFDFVWLRAMGFGKGTNPHCDLVYMGRGTHRLYTAWIPYGPVSYDLGGLMILEKSHLQADRIRNYLNSDVDSYCSNRPDQKGWNKLGGALSNNPVSLQEKMGGRWLTTEFEMGDILTFRMDLIHASTDNTTNRVRLSTDTRYQRSDEPVDERWVGENPIGHSTAGKRGRIC